MNFTSHFHALFPSWLAQTPSPSPSPAVDLDLVAENFRCGDGNVICTWVLDTTGNETLANLLGQVVPVLFSILLILIAAAVVARIARRLIAGAVRRTANESQEAIGRIAKRAPGMADGLTVEERRVFEERSRQRADTIGGVIGSIVAFVVWMIAVFIVLGQLDIDIGPLVAGAGVVGVALGFGAQSLVKDFLSGTFMLLEDQYGIGDVVNVGEATGVVEAISLRVTRLRDVEGTVWHVPNGEISRVGNMSQLWSRSLLDIGVSYDTDLDHASAVLTEVAHGMAVDPEWDPEILEEPELWGVQQFGPNEVVLRLVMKTRPASQWKVNREFRRRLKKAFDDAGIEIPFPQRTIWVKQDVPAAGVPAAAMEPGVGDAPVDTSPPEDPAPPLPGD